MTGICRQNARILFPSSPYSICEFSKASLPATHSYIRYPDISVKQSRPRGILVTFLENCLLLSFKGGSLVNINSGC